MTQSPTAPAHPDSSPLQYRSLTERFDAFEARSKGMPHSQRVALFRQSFNKLLPGYYTANADQANTRTRTSDRFAVVPEVNSVRRTHRCLRQLVEEARQCIFHAERAVYVARVANQGAQAVLHIGKWQYTDPYLVSLLNSITLPLYPNLELCLSSMSPTELEAEVLLGKLDLAIASGNFENPRISTRTSADTCLLSLFGREPPGGIRGRDVATTGRESLGAVRKAPQSGTL